jgi:hypothetical protein
LRALCEIEDNISNILSQASNKGNVEITYGGLEEHIRVQIDELIEEKSKELASIIQQCTNRVNRHNQMVEVQRRDARGSGDGEARGSGDGKAIDLTRSGSIMRATKVMAMERPVANLTQLIQMIRSHVHAIRDTSIFNRENGL